KVEPVDLPPESWYPGLRAFVRREETEKRDAACGVAADALEKAMLVGDVPAVRVAEAKFHAALSDRRALQARIAADDVKYHGARRGQPHLVRPLRQAAGRDDQQLRPQRQTADAPRIAGLVGQ